MIRNRLWDIFSFPDPHNKDEKWDILLHQSIFTLNYVKQHIDSLHKGSEADQCVAQNLMWSGVYLRSTLSNALLTKVLPLVTLTGPEVFVATMTTFLSDCYHALEETLTHTNSLKLKNYPVENVTAFYSEIFVDTERLESAESFKPENLGNITHMFENISDSSLYI